MIGRLIGLVCCILCSFPFFVISIYNKNSDEPISFWSGDNSLKQKVKNVKEYNVKMAGLYKKCALVFLFTGILFIVFPVVGVVLLVFNCSIGIYVVWRSYKNILNRYS